MIYWMASSVKVGANSAVFIRISAAELLIRLRCHELIPLSAENERSSSELLTEIR